MSKHDRILVVDFDAKRSQELVRSVRNAGVYSELVDYDYDFKSIEKDSSIKGIILSDSRFHYNDENSYPLDNFVFSLNIPILAVGYGAELMLSHYGCEFSNQIIIEETREVQHDGHGLFSNLEPIFSINFKDFYGPSHVCSDFVSIDNRFFINDTNLRYAYLSDADLDINHEIIHAFVLNISNAKQEWDMKFFKDLQTKLIREKVKDKKVLLALSGGVDSSVVAALLHHAIGDQLTCVFVDHGLLRKGERENVEEIFKGHFDMNLITVDAKERFLDNLEGESDPERKRKIIGETFIEVFEEETHKLEGIEFLAQGTIYPDVIESGTKTQEVIKSHHNVGGLPERLSFKLIEPLNSLFKDEVRSLGLELGLPEDMVFRQPFPGPGLGVRVLGDLTEEKLHIVSEADAIYREEIAKAGLDKKIWQYFAVLTNVRSVGQKDGKRTYDYTVALRAVHSIDGMTAMWAKIPHDVLEVISNRILSEVEGVNRVVYDISPKPTATIEWE